MTTLSDAIRAVVGGTSVNDGLKAYFAANGGVGTNLLDLERSFLISQLGLSAPVAATTNDLWQQFLFDFTGSLPDRLLQFWLAGGAVASFSPIDLYPSGEAGLWYRAGDFTRYTTAEYGAELWSDYGNVLGSGWTQAGDTYTHDGSGSTNFYKAGVTLTAGKSYRVTITKTGNLDIGVRVGSGGATQFSVVANGVQSGVAVADAGGFLLFQRNSGAGSVSVVSVKEVISISTATQYQESTGNTPVTAVEQPDGLVLDKRLGLVRSPERVPNPTWDGGYTTDGARQFPTQWEDLNGAAPVTSSTVAPNSFQFTASGHGSGIRSTDASASGDAVVGKFIEITIVARKTAILSGNPDLYINTGSWYTVIPQSATVGEWYEATIHVTPIDNVGFGQLNGVGVWEVKSISVKELPGNHALQATSAARPTLSARKNLLTKSNEIGHADWSINSNITVTYPAVASPAGIAQLVTPTATNGVHHAQRIAPGQTASVYAKAAGYNFVRFYWAGVYGVVNLTTGAVTSNNGTIVVADAGDGWWRISHSLAVPTTPTYLAFEVYESASGATFAGNGGGVYFAAPQIEDGPVATSYQRVNTATDYDTEGFLHYFKIDGVDDHLLATGGQTSNSDCFVLLRADSGSGVILSDAAGSRHAGFYGAYANGAINSVSPAATIKVNGVAVPGGTSVTAQQFKDALAPHLGQWVVVELLNLDLSAWPEIKIGHYSGLPVMGGIAEIILAPAQGADTRTAIREYLAAQGGITL